MNRGILLNPKNARSQHQAHFRFAPLKTNITENGNAVMPNFVAQRAFSTDAKHPTFTWGERSALFASVFVPTGGNNNGGGSGGGIDARTIATKVRPFKRAAAVARAAMPRVMYGVLITPFQQQQQQQQQQQKEELTAARGQRRRQRREGNVTGVVVTAFFNVRGTVLMDETVSDISPENCQGPCAIWGTTAVGGSSSSSSSAATMGAAVDPKSDANLFGLFD
jgi:hypothetical protein